MAEPCRESWDGMDGDDRVRFCWSCRKNVYHLSSMTVGEIEDLVQLHEGNVGVRFAMRADGTIVSAEGEQCGRGQKRARRRRAARRLAGAVGAAVGAAAFLAAASEVAGAAAAGSRRCATKFASIARTWHEFEEPDAWPERPTHADPAARAREVFERLAGTGGEAVVRGALGPVAPGRSDEFGARHERSRGEND